MSAQLLERRDHRGFRRHVARAATVQEVTDERHEQTLGRDVTLWYGGRPGPTILPAGTPITVLSTTHGLARIRYSGILCDYATIDVEAVRPACDAPDIG
jgi:hypothetical protein